MVLGHTNKTTYLPEDIVVNRIIRINEVKSKTGDGANSTVYGRVESGTLPPPVKIGPRASGWVEAEIDSVIDARIAGKSEDEIRELVKVLIAKRQKIADEILSAA